MKLRNMSHGIDYGYFGCFLGTGEFILDGDVISTFGYFMLGGVFYFFNAVCGETVHDGLGLYHLDD